MIINCKGEVALQRHAGEMSFCEIGKVLGLHEATVRMEYETALRKIKRLMGANMFFELLEAYREGVFLSKS